MHLFRRPNAPGAFALSRYYLWTPGGQFLYLIDASSGVKVYFYHFDQLESNSWPSQRLGVSA